MNKCWAKVDQTRRRKEHNLPSRFTGLSSGSFPVLVFHPSRSHSLPQCPVPNHLSRQRICETRFNVGNYSQPQFQTTPVACGFSEIHPGQPQYRQFLSVPSPSPPQLSPDFPKPAPVSAIPPSSSLNPGRQWIFQNPPQQFADVQNPPRSSSEFQFFQSKSRRNMLQNPRPKSFRILQPRIPPCNSLARRTLSRVGTV